MAEPTTLFVGLDVHKESIAVAHAGPDRSSEIVYVGQIGTREADLDKLLRRLHSHASRLVVAYRGLAQPSANVRRWLRPTLEPRTRKASDEFQ